MMEDEMGREIFGNAKRLALAAIALMAICGGAFGQQIRPQQPATRAANMGKGMALITPGLMEIGVQTKFLLTAADRIKLTDEQRTRLTEIAYQFQKLAGEKKADLGVAEAELQRMLAREQIDLAQVKAKLNQIQQLEADVEYAGIDSVLRAIKVLTHEQHLLIVTLITNPAPDQQKWQTQ
jgi:Spy/CpxP family protein refolding chaperone